MIYDKDLREKIGILLKILFSFAVIVFNMMKLLVKTFTMKLFAQINKFRKSIDTFLCDFLYSKFDVRHCSLERTVSAIKIIQFFISKTST